MEDNSEIARLRKVRSAWIERRDSLRLKEVTISDAAAQLAIEDELEKCIRKIEELDVEIDILNENIDLIPAEQLIIDEQLDNDEIKNAIEALKIEAKSLGYNSTKENIQTINTLRSKIYEKLFGEIDRQLEFTTAKNELLLSTALFETIYSSSKLDSITISEIQRLRENFEDFSSYDRSIVAAALSISLMNFKFDSKKANLLLDFLSDYEPGVWEKCLVGLTIAMVNQPNRSWMRSKHFTERLKTLKNVQNVQEGLKNINFILQNEMYKSALINPRIYALDLFKNPANYFVPFYEGNKVLKDTIDSASADFDIDSFIEFLDLMPLLDSHKYALCACLNMDSLSRVTPTEEDRKEIYYCYRISKAFAPYQTIISEYYTFFSFFKDKMIEDVFEKRKNLIDTELKQFVLDIKMKSFIEANALYSEYKYSAAIKKYEDVLKLDYKDREAKWKLARCYQENDEHLKAINKFESLVNELNENSINALFFELGVSCNALRNYKKSNDYLLRVSEKDIIYSCKLLDIVANNYVELNDNENSKKYADLAVPLAKSSTDRANLAMLYEKLKEYNIALDQIDKAILESPERGELYRIQSSIFSVQFNWTEAKISIKKALELKPNSHHSKLDYARVLLFSDSNRLQEAKTLLKPLLKTQFASVALGNLGHIELVQNNLDDAFDYYYKSLEKLIDAEDFTIKMEVDKPNMIGLGVDPSIYEECILNVISAFDA